MRLEHSFEVPVPVEHAWRVLLDIERVAPCMPGATLTSIEGDEFAGNVKVKLGPVNLTYKGSGRFIERDEAAHRVLVTASGADSRGAGTAAAKVTASLHAQGDGTRVEVVTDLDVTGKAAQFGRGLIGDVSSRLVGQFANCLAGKLAQDDASGGAAADESAAGGASTSDGGDAGTTTAEPAAVAATGAVNGSVPSASIAGGGAAVQAASSYVATPVDEAEPIDLLAVTGVGPAVRRAMRYVAPAVGGLAVVLGIIWWARR